MNVSTIDKAEDLPFTIIIPIDGTHCMKYYYMDDLLSKIVALPQRLTEPQNYSRFSAEVRHAGGENYNLTEYGTYCIQLKFAIDPLHLQCEDETFGNCFYVDNS